MTGEATDLALPTTREGWQELFNEAAGEIRALSAEGLIGMIGPEAALGFDLYAASDAIESLGMVAETIARAEGSPSEAIGAMLCAHFRLGVEYGVWLAARKGVRLP